LLERIALHQTRLHCPGLNLDAKGVALGSKGLVLLPSIDRLVALLAAYTRERSLEDLTAGLVMQVVKSRLGTREITLEFAAESSDRMDRIADTARLVGGFAFTGTSRHFVQYRDAGAPFGYDARQLLATDAALALYHERFSQTYNVEKRIELLPLLLRLMPQVDPRTRQQPGPRFVVAEQGLGSALVHYLVRSQVEGDVCVAEWPPASAFEDAPIRRWIFRIPELPPRMGALMHETPGITCFVPSGQGVAVEAGYRHPVELRSCPVFDAAGLVLIRGRGDEPWTIDRLPAMGALATFARVDMRDRGPDAAVARGTGQADLVRVPLRIVPSTRPWRRVTASFVEPAQVPLLRRLAYALPPSTIAQTRIAMTDRGAFLRSNAGIEAIPLGTFCVEVYPNLYIPAGHDVLPAIAPEVLARALGMPAGLVVFFGADSADARALAVEDSAFVPLEAALLAAPPWDPVQAEAIETALAESPVDLRVTSVGLLPLRGVEPRPKTEEA
jgi:hypothetical protein